ncbi:MAG: hypothetical protein Q4B82_01935 [Alysiella sp.]|uniref:hypothetical protein n=1 Tax=Alysiella sp. TaxID=1872483 RepID=UPI0026DBBAEA|nr:hypothetical protein [Alysiella sp.]MDO4433323.1 hypothetical protein [Alysiella sp.]
MINTVTSTAAKSFVISLILYLIQYIIGVYFMGEFMRSNLLNILITLMAINTATVAVILSKLYEISKQYNQRINDVFKSTKAQLLLSVREQVTLIGAALILSILSKKNTWSFEPVLINAGLEILLSTVFIYSLFILYDTAVAVLEFYE